jgi:hypothetical protein
MRDGKSKCDGNRGVDRVTPTLEHGNADVGSEGFLRHHHAVSRVHRLARH